MGNRRIQPDTHGKPRDFVFMDMASFEKPALVRQQIGDGRKYLKEMGMEREFVVSWNGRAAGSGTFPLRRPGGHPDRSPASR